MPSARVAPTSPLLFPGDGHATTCSSPSPFAFWRCHHVLRRSLLRRHFHSVICSFTLTLFILGPHGPHVDGVLGVFIPRRAASNPVAGARRTVLCRVHKLLLLRPCCSPVLETPLAFLPFPLCLLVFRLRATPFDAQAAFSSPRRRVALVFFSSVLCSFMLALVVLGPHGPHVDDVLGVFIPTTNPVARARRTVSCLVHGLLLLRSCCSLVLETSPRVSPRPALPFDVATPRYSV